MSPAEEINLLEDELIKNSEQELYDNELNKYYD
jgi:hypothetical protein